MHSWEIRRHIGFRDSYPDLLAQINEICVVDISDADIIKLDELSYELRQVVGSLADDQEILRDRVDFLKLYSYRNIKRAFAELEE